MAILVPLIFAAAHVGLCVLLINRLHSTALSHRLLKAFDLPWYVLCLTLPIGYAASRGGWMEFGPTASGILNAYAMFAMAAGTIVTVAWSWDRWRDRAPRRLIANHTERVDVASQLGWMPAGTYETRVASRLPGNQIFQLSIHEKTLRLDALPPALEGLTITHLSDLHFTGRVRREFFEVVVEKANELQSDLVVISGDIIDKSYCLDWLSEVLGKLEARHGKFFVLGNHDLRVYDEAKVRGLLTSAGFIDLGRRWHLVRSTAAPVALAGNELPWFTPAADARQIPGEIDGQRVFRIAVSHSPDQIAWARRHGFDLMLAGHTHGGQIRLPLIGPVFSPSRYGVRFASGLFDCPPTVLHVSRGVSGTRPLRYGCPPELAKLVLHGAHAYDSGR